MKLPLSILACVFFLASAVSWAGDGASPAAIEASVQADEATEPAGTENPAAVECAASNLSNPAWLEPYICGSCSAPVCIGLTPESACGFENGKQKLCLRTGRVCPVHGEECRCVVPPSPIP